jgi:hypothetical protein
MIDAVLDLLEKRLMANVAAARKANSDPLDCLRDILMRHVHFIREGRAFPRIIFSDDVFGGHQERRTRVQAIFAGYLAAIQQAVREGQSQGCIRRGLAPETVAMMFLGIVVPAGILWHLTEGGFNVTRHAGRAWKMFREAIAT